MRRYKRPWQKPWRRRGRSREMVSKLVPPKLEPVDDPAPSAAAPAERPDLRTAARRPKPMVGSLIAQGFVTEAEVPERFEPDDMLEGITVEVPRRLKRALHSEDAARRDDPGKRAAGCNFAMQDRKSTRLNSSHT